MTVINWIIEHWDDVLAIIGSVVLIASTIVKLTPTQKDDTVLAKVINILAALSLYNPDGSLIGEKKQETKDK